MAFIVLAVGLVMALLGAVAIVTGYPIIQIERGWATVIAGTTLLAGGVVTIALGLLLRAIMDLRGALANAAFASPRHAAETQAMADGYATPHVEPAFHGDPEPAAADPAPHHVAAAIGAVALPAAAVAMSAPHEPEPERHHAEDEPVPPVAAREPIETDHHGEPDVADTHGPDRSPPMDDWLDKAFADLALEATPLAKETEHGPSTQVEPEPLHPEQVVARHDGEILYADDEAAHVQDEHAVEAPHDPAHHEAEHDVHVGYVEAAPVEAVPVETAPVEAVEHHAEAAHEPPAPTEASGPAVIGRYEADGTSYTMYADGSIEAQSDAGIYRFASMADLKAFIEG